MSTLTVGDIATVAWGYTMSDIDRLARQAGGGCRVGFMLDARDRFDYAWHAIVEKLYDAETTSTPSELDLVRTAMNALQHAVVDNLHHHGTGMAAHRNTGAEVGPRFTAYWAPLAGSADDFTDRLTEKMALPQILATLTAQQYEALAALAAHGSINAAAAAVGLSTDLFKYHLRKARRQVISLWLAPETVPPPPDPAHYCRFGHPRSRYGQITAAGKLVCVKCRRIRHRRAYWGMDPDKREKQRQSDSARHAAARAARRSSAA